ncbi:MAG: SIS domain-containing protein, partial [Planctomycetota bacterium]
EIHGASNGGTIRVVSQGGGAKGLASRTAQNKALRGTKNTVAMEKRVLVAVGRSDQRPIVLVPETVKGVCTGIILLHTDFRSELDSTAVRGVLSGYRNRYALIRDALNEANVEFEDEDLTRIGILRLLTEPVLVLADELAALRK